MAEAFQVGETVRLKSGSPRLSIVSIDDNRISVSWITYGTHLLQIATFPIECLERSTGYRCD